MRNLLVFLKRFVPESVMERAHRAYDHLPYSLKYGKVYRDTLKLLEESQWWPEDRLEEFQLAMLQDLVSSAYHHVPFYRDIYDSWGCCPADLKDLEDIQKFPFVTKDDLRHRRESLKSNAFPENQFQYHTTGGSTATPVGLYWQANRTVPMEKAFMKRQYDWVNYDFGKDRAANFRGIPPRNGMLFEYNGNILNLNSYRATADNLAVMVEEIRRFEPTAIHVYPSTALILSSFLKEFDVRIDGLRVVLCGSERLLDWQRSSIEEGFRARVYSWYGQSEYVSLAGECEYSRELHFYNEYGLTEFITSKGTHAGKGESGEIVASGFLNFAFPLIRYRTEDWAVVSELVRCQCGRHYRRASSIDGRTQEVIVSRNGNLIPMTAINMHDDLFDNILQFQFFQEEQGKLELRLVPGIGFSEKDVDKIHNGIVKKIEDQFEFSIVVVDDIPRTKRGKITFLDQRLDVSPFLGPDSNS